MLNEHLKTVILALVCLLALNTAAGAVDEIEIDCDRDARLLQYTFVEQYSHDWGAGKVPVSDAMQVYRVQDAASDTALLVHAFNGDVNRDEPAVFSFNDVTHSQVLDWDPLYVTISGFRLYYDSKTGDPAIAGGCYRNDSAFVVRIVPRTDRYNLIFLASGEDLTGNGAWEGRVSPVLVDDYDYDGVQEVFFYLDPGRDLRPRILYCVEPENLRLEWSLPVAAPVSVGNILSCRDSLHPAVMFATYNYKNGVEDDSFSDRFCYLAKVDSQGRLLFRRILSEEHGSKGIWHSERDECFYVFHALPMIEPDQADDLPPHRYQLSKIDRDGRLLKTVDVGERIRSGWRDDYDGDGTVDFYTLSSHGIIRVYDDNLTLLARSHETNLKRFLDTVRVEGQVRPAYLFLVGDGTGLYSPTFKRLAHLDVGISCYHPTVLDDGGHVVSFIATRDNMGVAVGVKRKEFGDFARILFWEYQDYVLLVLSALLLALVIVNTYRQKTARRLAKSQEQLHSILESTQDIFFKIDSHGRVQWVSSGGARVLGYGSPDDLVGMEARSFYADPDRRDQYSRLLKQSGKVTAFEAELIVRNGRRVIVSISSTLLRDRDGAVIGSEGVARDITQRERTDEALRVSEQRYRTLVEGAHEAIFTVDREGVFLYLNNVSAGVFGREPQELVGSAIQDCMPHDQASPFTERITGVFETGSGVIFESDIESQGKKTRYLTSMEPIRDKANAVASVLVISRDITALIQTQQELQSERDFIHSLLDTANSLIVCLDGRARITVFNREIEKVTGYSREEVIGKSWPEIFLPTDHHHHHLKSFADWVRQTPRNMYEGPLRTRSGEIRTILWSNSALFSADSEELTAIAVGQDITERRLAHQALRESNQRYVTLAESSTDGILAAGAKTRKYIYANPAMCRMLGYSRTELLQMRVGDLIPKSQVQHALSEFRRVTNDTRRLVSQLPMVRKDGRVIYVDISSSRQKFDGQDAVIGFYRDVTERIHAEEAIRASEEKYRLLVQNVGAVIALVSWEGKFLFVNENAARALNRKSDEIAGKSQWDLFPKDVADRQMRHIRRVIESKTELTTESRGFVGGQWRWFHTNLQPYRDAQGTTTAALVIAHDVTMRREAEDALRKSEKRFRELAELLPLTLFEMDSDGSFTFANQHGFETTGYTGADLDKGLNALDLFVPEDRDRVREDIDGTLNGEGISGSEYTVLRKDGSTFPVMIYTDRIVVDGSAVGLRGIIIDITKRRETERKLAAANRERYDQVRRIAGGVAHEIYNALFPATSSLYKLKERLHFEEPEEIRRNRKLLGLTESAVERAIDMTGLVAQFSKLESQKKTEKVNLRSVLLEVLESNESRIDELGVSVNLEIADHFTLRSFRPHIHSLFNNLTVNALDAMRDTPVRVLDISARKDGRRLKVEFADTGCGIDGEEIPRVFDAFYSTKPTSGTGLGLAMVRKIAELYDGDVTIESEIDKGTKFVIFFVSG